MTVEKPVNAAQQESQPLMAQSDDREDLKCGLDTLYLLSSTLMPTRIKCIIPTRNWGWVEDCQDPWMLASIEGCRAPCGCIPVDAGNVAAISVDIAFPRDRKRASSLLMADLPCFFLVVLMPLSPWMSTACIWGLNSHGLFMLVSGVVIIYRI